MQKLQDEFTKLEELIAQDNALVEKIQELNKEILDNNNEIIIVQRLVQALNLELNDIQTKNSLAAQKLQLEKEKLQVAREKSSK